MGSFFSAFSSALNVFSVIVYIIFYIAVYAAASYGIYKAAINNQIAGPWIAFIPVLQLGIIGRLTEEYYIKGFKIPKLEIVLPVLFLFKLLLKLLLGFKYGLVFIILRFLVSALLALILHKFFYLYKPQKAVMYAVLCFIFGEIAFSVIMFLLKDDSMIMSPGAYQYPFN